MKEKNTKKGFVYSLIIVLMGIALVFAFYRMATREFGDSADNVEGTPITDITTRALEANYPPTPREVVKFYSEIILCYYNENPTDTEIEELGKQARVLFDDSLLEENEEEEYYDNLKTEIAEYHNKEVTIISYTVEDKDDIEYVTEGDTKYALVTVEYFMKSGDAFQKTIEDYVLVKDSEELWKIHGYTISETNDTSEDDN